MLKSGYNRRINQLRYQEFHFPKKKADVPPVLKQDLDISHQ
jgi:hypothetical protein